MFKNHCSGSRRKIPKIPHALIYKVNSKWHLLNSWQICCLVSKETAVDLSATANMSLLKSSSAVLINSCCNRCISSIASGGSRGGRSPPPLKPRKVNLFAIILRNSENSIRDTRPFKRPLFCHNSVVKYTSSLLQKRTRKASWLHLDIDYQIILKSPP